MMYETVGCNDRYYCRNYDRPEGYTRCVDVNHILRGIPGHIVTLICVYMVIAYVCMHVCIYVIDEFYVSELTTPNIGVSQ